ncbi:DUF4276 family protein [Streptomyces sp. CB03911]|uniref:DUF4276 family protein n=1 Tax=Streptomyces sp. CB03911 TaxID=1804758 RepID=UPI00093C81E9|nr:DUF4276 family protein [Streptomyces sp. CB03911]OKI24763.1 hypothetical protein A6A07_31955 [Streptomyces sp. CB03911]
MTLRVLFLGEGSSDEGLVPHIERIAAELDVPVAVSSPALDWISPPVGHSVADKLRAVRGLSDTYDLAVLQRDADRGPDQDRRDEIAAAVRTEWPGLAHMPVVPVRMLEAWLLLDEQAIRQVAGNPNGRMDLQLPRPSTVERIPDPKQQLKETLALASGAKGRRLAELQKRFPRNRHRLFELLDQEGPVSQVPSWHRFVTDLTTALTNRP